MSPRVDKKKLIDLFYEQSKTFAERNQVSVADIADAQFHASMRLTCDRVDVQDMMIWIEKQSGEFRRGLARTSSWTNRKAAAKKKAG